jgi:hypothetical protein
MQYCPPERFADPWSTSHHKGPSNLNKTEQQMQ